MPSAERPPFEAYKGPKPFVFVSYAHKDSSLVFPELVKLSSWGFNIWYDEGIDPGNEWPDEIAQALKNSAYFIFFVSGNSANSVNCRNEVYYAQNSRKPFLCIYLEETALDEINPGLALSIGSLQAVMRYQMDDESYKRKICKALASLAPIKSQPLLPVSTKPDSSSGTLSRRGSSSSVLSERLLLAGTLVVGLIALYFLVTFQSLRFSAVGRSVVPDLVSSNPVAAAAGSNSKPVTNSLGMKFVPAGTAGILFSIYDTRVRDFKAFKEAIGQDYAADSKQTLDDPVVNVSWNDAQEFCKWLTEKELKAGLLHAGQRYRLPKDAEWSRAVGLNEDPNKTPDEKNQKIPDVYPWGTQFPPPPGTGNFACRDDDPANQSSEILYGDGFANTSPVGRFRANPFGLYDMAGNVWQWCDDPYEPGQEARVRRKSSWPYHQSSCLLSSSRQVQLPGGRCGYFGFRCVLESGVGKSEPFN
jgi:formylglycine-generating enzyme required for sulfatase activity